jgi:hypothetical protein
LKHLKKEKEKGIFLSLSAFSPAAHPSLAARLPPARAAVSQPALG